MLCLGLAVKTYDILNDKVIVSLDKGNIHLSSLTDNTVRIQYVIALKTKLLELVFVTKRDVPDFKVL